jgi:hypothetical protein
MTDLLAARSQMAMSLAFYIVFAVVGRVAAIVQASWIVVGWALAQYPYLVVTDLTLHHAAAEPAVLREGGDRVRRAGQVRRDSGEPRARERYNHSLISGRQKHGATDSLAASFGLALRLFGQGAVEARRA